MLGPARGSSAPPYCVRWLLSLAAWISIAGGPLASTGASAAPSERVAPGVVQAASDSVASPELRKPAPATPPTGIPATGVPATGTQSSGTQSPATQSFGAPTPKGPKPKANSIDLNGGLFVPIDVNAPSPTLGVRLGRRLGAHLQGGLLLGWTYERKNLEQPANGLPGLQPQLILARAEGSLVPAMAFFEVSLTEKRYLVPYGGIAAGYEWLYLHANDYRTGETASTTFANWAWQSWGGIGLRLDQGLRFDVELFYNGGSLERDATDASGLREAVVVNGVGARVGLDILY